MILAAILILPASATNLSGTIVYKTAKMVNAAPLAQAMVSVYATANGAKSVTLSSDQGAYFFTKLAAGTYIIIVEKKGRRLYQGRVELRERGSRFDIRL
ncbi:MAG TPA: carboxypeptidase-like regulatory domain-containing protein [Bryobacteraceae bacterium]